MELSTLSGLFFESFNAPPKAVFFCPGRVSLMGESISSSLGLQVSATVNKGVYVAVTQRGDSLMQCVSSVFVDAPREWESSTLIAEDNEFDWSNDLQLLNQLIVSAFGPVKGMNVYIHSQLPAGAGLSASFAVLVAFAQALNELNGLCLSPFCIAQVCLQVKHSLGAATAVLSEPLTLVNGQESHVLVLDGQDNSQKAIAWPEEWALLLVDLKTPKGFVTSAYLQRRAQCETACHAMGVGNVRQLTLPLLQSAEDNLDPLVLARARHGVLESERCVALAEAIAQRDLPRVGQLMAESSASLRADLDITTDRIDWATSRIAALLGPEGAVRLSGGGFGGSLLVVVPKAQSAARQVQIQAALAACEWPKPVVMPLALGGAVCQLV